MYRTLSALLVLLVVGCSASGVPATDAGGVPQDDPEPPGCPVGLWHRAVVPCAQFFTCDAADAPEECALDDCLVSRVLGFRGNGDFLAVSLLWSSQEARYSAAQAPDMREWTVDDGTLSYDGAEQGDVSCDENKLSLDGVTQGEPLDAGYEEAVWRSWEDDAWAGVAY